ncbi:DUF7168 domain-containing protein [Rhizobium mayense]|uniref:DUF2786 domain-containing protein n=1 Tax=Rhizobium mayense TaxID=1312184 RepID=A0ABT7JY51_9HYPH|nr:DUF2786 domain-containing protein [Rhizobium mayense]MDL2401279.1 DUF2786 domain-containing protein [Rhizobium mayense]
MDRDDLKRRINSLRRMTTGSGCTEQEALAAAAKAAELMASHGLSADELEMTSSTISTDKGSSSPESRLWGAIASCTNTSVLWTMGPEGKALIFIGRDPWPEIAGYLVDVCSNAVKFEQKKFRAGEFYKRRRATATRRQALRDFTYGLIVRIVERLRELFAATISDAAQAAARAERDRQFASSKVVKSAKYKPRFDQAISAGWRAGGDVHLSHGVGTRSARKLIGGAA